MTTHIYLPTNYINLWPRYVHACVYMCMYIRSCVCVHGYMCMYESMSMYSHACVPMLEYALAYLCVCSCMHPCVYICMCVCACVYIYMYEFISMYWVIVRPDDDIHRKSTVTDSLESDHYCTKSYFNISVSKPSTLYRTDRNIANIDRPSLIAELSSLSEFSSVENANQFCDFLRTVLDKHAPPSLRKVITHSSCPWFESIRDELFIAKRERRQADRKWRNTKLTISKDLYGQAKHKVSKLVHTAKCKFYTEK